MSAVAAALLHITDILQPQWHESVAIRHLDLRQALRVQDVALLDDVVAKQHEGGQSVNLGCAQRSSLTLGHGAIDIVPDGGRKRPVAPDGPDGLGSIDRAFAAQQARSERASLRGGPVARRAPFRKNPRAFLGGAAPWRKFFSLRADRDVPGLNFVFGRAAADVVIGRCLCPRGSAGRKNHHGKESLGGPLPHGRGSVKYYRAARVSKRNATPAHCGRSRRGSPSRSEWR